MPTTLKGKMVTQKLDLAWKQRENLQLVRQRFLYLLRVVEINTYLAKNSSMLILL